MRFESRILRSWQTPAIWTERWTNQLLPINLAEEEPGKQWSKQVNSHISYSGKSSFLSLCLSMLSVFGRNCLRDLCDFARIVRQNLSKIIFHSSQETMEREKRSTDKKVSPFRSSQQKCLDASSTKLSQRRVGKKGNASYFREESRPELFTSSSNNDLFAG